MGSLSASFAQRLRDWRLAGLASTLSAWTGKAYPVGTALSVNLDAVGTVSGEFAGLDPDGALRLRLADGSLRVVHAGDVSLA